MAENMAKAEQGSRNEQELQRIISDKMSFDIISTSIKKRILVKLFPDGSVLSRVVDLTPSNDDHIKLETGFTELTRNYIAATLDSKATSQQIDTTDNVGPNLLTISLGEQVGDAVKTLYQKGIPEEEIKRWVITQGKKFSGGEEHMGMMPSVVKEIVVELNTRIEDYFKRAEKIKKKK